jgi:hypothetical protein
MSCCGKCHMFNLTTLQLLIIGVTHTLYKHFHFYLDWPNWDENSGVSHIAREVNEWLRVWAFCYTEIQTMFLELAPDAFRSRALDGEHAKELAESFRETGTVNKDSVSVVLHDGIASMVRENANLTWTAILNKASNDRIPLWLLGGNHTHSALAINELMFPKESLWQEQFCRTIIATDTEENRRMCRLYANLLNRKHVQKKTEWNEAVIQMHDQAVAEVESLQRQRKGVKKHKKFCDLKAEPEHLDLTTTKILQKDVVDTTKFAEPTVKAYWQLSQRGGAIWDHLYKLLSPKPVSKANSSKGPKKSKDKVPGYSVFNQMGSVPDWYLLKILTQLSGGNITDKEFVQRCINFKATRRMNQYMFVHAAATVNSNREWAKEVKEWKQVADADDMTPKRLQEMFTLFKELKGQAFQEKWMKTFITLKKKVGMKAPEEFYSEVTAVVTSVMNKKVNQVTPMPNVTYLIFKH